jgi:hypothetical protein
VRELPLPVADPAGDRQLVSIARREP